MSSANPRPARIAPCVAGRAQRVRSSPRAVGEATRRAATWLVLTAARCCRHRSEGPIRTVITLRGRSFRYHLIGDDAASRTGARASIPRPPAGAPADRHVRGGVGDVSSGRTAWGPSRSTSGSIAPQSWRSWTVTAHGRRRLRGSRSPGRLRRCLLDAPAAFSPEPVAIAVYWVLFGAAAVAAIRLLKLPLWWILFPPLSEAVIVINADALVLLALVVGGAVAGTSVALKSYAAVPLLLQRNWRGLAGGSGPVGTCAAAVDRLHPAAQRDHRRTR